MNNNLKGKHHMIKTLIAAAALAACAAPALAVTFEGSLTQGATVVTDYAGPSLVSFDIDFANFQTASLDFRIDSGDTAPLALSAVLRNFIGSGVPGWRLTLDRGTFASIGSVTTGFGGSAQVSNNGSSALVSFSTPEFLDTELGNAYGTTAGAVNWTLAGLVSGDRFSITVSPVPEPGAVALVLAGLGAVGVVVQRRRR